MERDGDRARGVGNVFDAVLFAVADLVGGGGERA